MWMQASALAILLALHCGVSLGWQQQHTCVRESVAASAATAFHACDESLVGSLGEGSNWHSSTIDDSLCTDAPHIYGACFAPAATPAPTTTPTEEPTPSPTAMDAAGSTPSDSSSSSIDNTGSTTTGSNLGIVACTDAQKTANTNPRKARYTTAQAAMHKMFIAVARYNKENPGTYCNAASCTNPSACNVVLPPCRVLLSCDGHFNCTVNGSALNPPWLVYENCSRATMQAEADAIAADASMIEALPTGAENTLEAVPTLFGDARGTHGVVDTHGVQYWQQETSKLPCALPAYDSSYMLTNAASQLTSTNPMACRPAKCIGQNNGPIFNLPSAFQTTETQVPNHQCTADCSAQLNQCDGEAGGVFTCSKYCIRLLPFATAQQSGMSGSGNCQTLSNLQEGSGSDVALTEVVWPALVSKSIACSKVCYNSAHHPVECVSSANLSPKLECYTKKSAKLYNCAKRCPNYKDHCDFGVDAMMRATDGNSATYAPNVTDCIEFVGHCLRGADSSGQAYCEEIDSNSYRVDTDSAACVTMKKFHATFMRIAAAE